MERELGNKENCHLLSSKALGLCSFLYRTSRYLWYNLGGACYPLDRQEQRRHSAKTGSRFKSYLQTPFNTILSLARSEVSKGREQSGDSPRALQPLGLGSEKELPTASNPEDGSDQAAVPRVYTVCPNPPSSAH